MKNSWWGMPRKITDIIDDRKISWLELFSDLVYVVIIHGFVENLSTHFTLTGFISFWTLFLFIFNTWNNMVLFFDLHGGNNLRNTFFALLQIIAIGFTATFTPAYFNGHYTGFIIFYTFNQLIYMYLFLLTMLSDPEHAITTRPFLIAYLIGEIIFVGSIFAPNIGVQRIMILISLLIFIGFVMFERNNFNREFNNRGIPFTITPAIMERYGLFTMIVFGESLAGLIEHGENLHHISEYALFLVLLLSVIAIWFVYYTFMDRLKIKAKSYGPLSFFRGLHRLFITCLILQSFFIAQLFEESERVFYIGYLIVTIILLLILFAMQRLRIFNPHPLQWKVAILFPLTAICLLVLTYFPILLGLLIAVIMLFIIAVSGWLFNV
ncbi:low temperature requirement protein A [Weissella koreensis]|uniref:low temperature requirement protein A n=1 Tax=Weissella koreensis TaxID=165096 RepID=UPI0022BA5EFF|nr:low temperature requirement protein A [Weissella koreensis]MCZ9310806.1 low temperature requirement protein A [Weissella koreensis]